MDFKFKSLAEALGLKSSDASITEANLKQANDTIEQLQRDKTGAEEKAATALKDLATAQASLKTAQADLTTAQASLKTANDKVATLEQWKKEQTPEDERDTDASTNLDGNDEPKAGFELAAQAAISSVKKRLK